MAARTLAVAGRYASIFMGCGRSLPFGESGRLSPAAQLSASVIVPHPMPLRDALIPNLVAPRCARELRERTGCSRKAVEAALSRLVLRGWVKCVTPGARQSRLYQLSVLGFLLAEGAGIDVSRREHYADMPLDLYAWMQSGVYRRMVLRHLDCDLSPKQLRLRIVGVVRMGASHVHHTLRDLRQRGVVSMNTGRWSLTTAGERLREHQLEQAPRRPSLLGTGAFPPSRC